MAGERVTIEISGGVADVRLNRPDKLNALDPDMFAAIVEAGERLRKSQGVRAVVLSGSGRGFCAGLDKDTFAGMADGRAAGVPSDLMARTHGLANAPQQAAFVWRELPVPVIAAIHGVALGGGFQIALGADIRYVAPEARLSILEIKWGLVPDMAGFALARGLVRDDVLRELCMTGRIFSGLEAASYGFATAAHDDPLAAALRTAEEIAGRSPDAVRAIKRLINGIHDADTGEILMAELQEQTALIGSSNQVEAIRAGMGNRTARFVDPD